MAEKTVFSAIKPTNLPTIGNYIGAIKNMVAMQKDNNCLYSVADLHCITVTMEPAKLRSNILDMFSLYIACGIDVEKSILFVQSHVPAHCELAWILNCFTQFGEAKRMTQFKDKSRKNPENINVGLFDYPVLMAADILLYGTELVPVGKDQKQHVELARTIAERFNNRYSPTFAVPEPILPTKGAAKIGNLSDPASKMGKTDGDASGTVFILDSPDDIMRKFKRAVTDSGHEIKSSEDKPGISNLINIYCAFTGKSIAQTESEFDGKDYAVFKTTVGEAVVETLKPIQKKYAEIRADKAYIDELMMNGAQRAAKIARKTLDKVYRKAGFYSPRT